ncbi:cadherin-89D-like [Tachypleus tridentatus]|uniref:cadherin-89D-like n=1 Tax=Tachypleus tridentatus TaxID=6853 RepID=UPI003FD3172A
MDYSNPPNSDKTQLNIIVGAGTGVRLFTSRLYEVTVKENQVAPLPVIDLNTTDEIAHKPVQYDISEQDVDGMFDIEKETGLLILTKTLDREEKSQYILKIRADDQLRSRYKRSVDVHELESYNLAYDETLVLVTVGDQNDNNPVFQHGGRSIVVAVPLEAAYGFEIIQIKAHDADDGYNAAIRYHIIQKNDDASSKFHIDPVTGVIRSMVTFSLDTRRVFTFDVQATDREGSDTGHSAVTSILIYVLPETKLVMIVSDRRPLVVEQNIDQVIGYLTNTTGYDIRLAKLESHHEGEQANPKATDLFLYGIDRGTNDIVDTELLLNLFIEKSETISEGLSNYQIRRIQGVYVHQKISRMGTTEVAIIALSSVIFLGGVLGITLLCSSCKKRKVKKQQATLEQQKLYSVKNPLVGKTVDQHYERRVPNGITAFSPPSYTNGTSNTEFFDSVIDQKDNKRSRQHVPPDGASSHTRSKSPKCEGFPKKSYQWEDYKDEVDSFGTRFSSGSKFSSWSSKHSHRSKPKSNTHF